jgi:hypothetical protein
VIDNTGHGAVTDITALKVTLGEKWHVDSPGLLLRGAAEVAWRRLFRQGSGVLRD